MNDPARIIATAVILSSLTVASVYFNKYIDRTHQTNGQHRPDGITALWVAGGVVYTLIPASVLVGIWADRMPEGWLMAVPVGILHLLAFFASGAPMLRGDMNRSAVIRTLRHARKTLRNGNGDTSENR